MLSKKTIIILVLTSIVATAGIFTPFIVMALINAQEVDDHIYVVQGVVEMPYTLVGCKGVSCYAETFIEYEFNSTKPNIDLYIVLDYPNSVLKTLTWGDTTYISGVLNVTGMPGSYSFNVWNLDEDKEKVNITFRLRYDNPWYQGDGTPGW